MTTMWSWRDGRTVQHTAYTGRCVTVDMVPPTPVMLTAEVVRFCRLRRLSREAACHCAHTPEHDTTLEEIYSFLPLLYEARDKADNTRR